MSKLVRFLAPLFLFSLLAVSSLASAGDWFCNDLALGTGANEGGSAKWSFHSVSFRGNGESYNHYATGNWQGIVPVVRSAMVNSAT